MVDLGELERVLDTIVRGLNHHVLNDNDGIEVSTLERIAELIARLAEALGIDCSKIELTRPTFHQRVTFTR